MYQDEIHPPMLNELTKRLLAEGHTRENYPDNVYWSDWQNFGYKWEYMLSLIWETPCGLFIKGDSETGRSIACGDMYFNSVWHCPENNNPDIKCPLKKYDCPHRIEKMPLIRCACHLTEKPYDYNNSVDKILTEQDKTAHKQYKKLSGGQFCACVVSSDNNYYEVKFDVEKCINYGCQNEICSIRKQKRDLKPVNVVYDIRRTWITKKGFIEDKRIEIEKGVKVFSHPVAQTDAEIWIKTKGTDFRAKKSATDRREQWFSTHHRQYGDYEYFEFHYEVENVRIENPRSKRDLLQDLQDIAEGIKVEHASDKQKAVAAAKRERKQKAKAKKIERLENLLRTVGYDDLDDIDKIRVDKAISKGDMEWIDIEEQKEPDKPKFEQMEMTL